MAEATIWNLIREVRTRAGLNPRELARQLKMSPAHLYQIEDEKSGVLPSDETLRAIARVCCEDLQERAAVTQSLLLARARLIVSPEVAAYLSPRGEEKMPEEFQRRVQADLKGRSETEIRFLDAQLGFNGRLGLEAAGPAGLTKSEVRALAVALDQAVEDYCALRSANPQAQPAPTALIRAQFVVGWTQAVAVRLPAPAMFCGTTVGLPGIARATCRAYRRE